MNFKNSALALVLAGSIVVLTGALEDAYGRFDYAGDAIAYLDLSKAIGRGDWALAVSPYWSPGYPVLAALARELFPAGPEGEWAALHVLNLLVFVATYLAFLFFLKAALEYAASVSDDGMAASGPQAASGPGFFLAIGTTLFLLEQLGVGNISRVSPDLLVSGLFFLASAFSLRFLIRPAAGTAILLGLVIGLGYLAKAVFLPLSVGVLLTVLLRLGLRPGPGRRPALLRLAWALPAAALFAVPCILAVSRATGRFTWGESGPLNYAWAVNHLPQWIGWQGGPSPLGTPLHPLRLGMTAPPVFEFAQPFPVTYPPWFNPFYWYDGYRRFFSFHQQCAALKVNLEALLHVITSGRHAGLKTLAKGACVGAAFLALGRENRRAWWQRFASLWPMYLPSILGIALYLLVVVEARYVTGFLVTLAVVPFLPLFAPTPLVGKRTACALFVLVAAGCAASVDRENGDVIRRAIHHQSHLDDEQWKIGAYLRNAGLPAGARVAVVQAGDAMSCTWAYVADLHIVAGIGNGAFDPERQEQDLQLFARHPSVQQRAFRLFRQAGAVIVVARGADAEPLGSGWEQIPGTQAWVYRLPPIAGHPLIP